MKNYLFLFVNIFLCCIFSACSCDTQKVNQESSTSISKAHGSLQKYDINETEEDYNISILLDLSDRITKNSGGMSQDQKDLALVNQIIDEFIEEFNTKGHISKRKGQIKVFFYPVPNTNDINKAIQLLDVRFSALNTSHEKREARNKLKDNFNKTLTQIYADALNGKNWVGSDIWGFFDTRVEKQCIKKGYRNLLVIISDGYLYYQPTWKQTGNGIYTGMTTKTIQSGQIAITPINKDLSDLEVLFLEVDPQPQTQFHTIVNLLSEWFKGMGVKRFEILETDIPGNNKTPIEDFFKNRF